MQKEINIRTPKIFYDKLKIDQYRFEFSSFQLLCNRIFYNTNLDELHFDKLKFNYNSNVKFKLNKTNKEKYDNYFQQKENINTDSDLFRTIFISYLDMPSFKREIFLFQEEYKKINIAIQGKKKLNIEYHSNKLTIEPYFIKTIENHPFNLIFSYSSKYKQEHYVTYHLSKIKNIELLDKNWEHYNEKEINNKKINFDIYETESKIENILVKLNKRGKLLFDRYSYNRPNNFIRTNSKNEKENKQILKINKFKEKYKLIFPEIENINLKNDEYLYYIQTSVTKMKLYFHTLSNNFEILYPPELRSEFKKIFLEAYNNHK